MANNEPLVDQETERQLNPIACSHCRQRKRKCDRTLPHCLQCSNDPTKCQYPEQNKRGLPIGFITRLEARLAETEEALFRLVQSTEDPGNNQIPLKLSPQRKDDRIREWDSLPLKTLEEVKVWYRNRSGQNKSPVAQGAPMDLDQQELPNHVTPSDTDRVELPDDIQSNSGADIVLPDPEVEADLRNETNSPRVSIGSKAKEMEQKNPHMYF